MPWGRVREIAGFRNGRDCKNCNRIPGACKTYTSRGRQAVFDLKNRIAVVTGGNGGGRPGGGRVAAGGWVGGGRGGSREPVRT